MTPYKILAINLTIVFLLFGCTIEEPAEPTWEVKTTFPVINSKYNAIKLLNENSDVGVIEDNDILALLYNKQFETLEVGDTLTIPDTFSVLNFSVGQNIEVPFFDVSTSQTLGDIAEESGIPKEKLDGQTEIPSPGFDDLESKEYNYTLDDFEYIEVSEGKLVVSLINNTGILLTNVEISLYNTSVRSRNRIGRITFASLPSGATESQELDLSGETIQQDLIAKITDGEIPPQSGVTINLESTVAISVTRSETFDFSKARTKIKSQIARDTSRLTVVGDELLELEEAILKKGDFSIQLKNEVEIEGTATLKIPEVTLNSQPLEIPLTIPEPGQVNTSQTKDLTGYRIQSTDGTTVEYILELAIIAGNSFVEIDATDSIRATAMAKNLTGSYFKGKTKAIEYDVSQQSITIDAFDQIRNGTSLQLFDPKAEARFSSSAGFDIKGNATFSAVNSVDSKQKNITLKSGQPIQLDIPKVGVQTLNFDTLNSNISEVFNILPNSFSLSGLVTVNPTENSGEVYDTSKVRLSLDVLVPLVLSIDSLSGTDTSSVEVSNTEDLSEMRLELIAKSAIPVGSKFRAIFYNAENNPITLESGKMLSIPRADSAMAVFNAAPIKVSSINSSFYESDGYSETSQIFEFNDEEIRKLEGASYAVSTLKADTQTEGLGSANKVIIKSTDIIEFRAVGRVNYKVNQDQ